MYFRQGADKKHSGSVLVEQALDIVVGVDRAELTAHDLDVILVEDDHATDSAGAAEGIRSREGHAQLDLAGVGNAACIGRDFELVVDVLVRAVVHPLDRDVLVGAHAFHQAHYHVAIAARLDHEVHEEVTRAELAVRLLHPGAGEGKGGEEGGSDEFHLEFSFVF